MLNRRKVLFAICMLVLAQASVAAEQSLLVSSYDTARMNSIKHLTFPRVLVYDQYGKLIERAAWPSKLSKLKSKAGDAFCCVSEKSSPPGSQEPPPDCKPLVYGADVQEHFNGLHDATGKSLAYKALPAHKYLVVEYYANWCSPCQPARRELEAFFSSSASKGYLGLIVDFSKLATK